MPIDAVSGLASNATYMQRLIDITKSKVEVLSTDYVMRYVLSALWNLTDESPKACHRFFKLEGIDLAVNCLAVGLLFVYFFSCISESVLMFRSKVCLFST